MNAERREGRPPRSVSVLTLAFLGVLGATTVVEILLRLMGYGVGPDTTGAHRFHPVLGWEKVPGMTSEFKSPEYHVIDRVNSRGLRGVERPYAKPPGTVRVLVLGDSFTEAHSVSHEKRFTTLLESMLLDMVGRRGGIEVLNGGTDGYSTDQELLFFLEEGRKYRPDVVLLMLYPENDVYDNVVASEQVSRKPKPQFALVNGSLQLTHKPLPPPGTGGGHERRRGNFLNHLAFYRFLQLSLRYPLVVFGKRMPEQFSVWRIEENETFREAWLLTGALLAAFADAVRKENAKLVVCVLPSRIQVSREDWRSFVSTYRLAETEWNLEKTTTRLGKICREARLRCLDLLSDFRQVSDSARLFYSIDRHLHPRGHRLVAERLRDYLMKEFPSLIGVRRAE
jgi:hypothetical protein